MPCATQNNPSALCCHHPPPPAPLSPQRQAWGHLCQAAWGHPGWDLCEARWRLGVTGELLFLSLSPDPGPSSGALARGRLRRGPGGQGQRAAEQRARGRGHSHRAPVPHVVHSPRRLSGGRGTLPAFPAGLRCRLSDLSGCWMRLSWVPVTSNGK